MCGNDVNKFTEYKRRLVQFVILKSAIIHKEVS